MRKLVVFGTGNFGEALMASAKACSQLEPSEDTYVLEGTDIDRFRKALSAICRRVYKNDSLLLMADDQNSPIVKEAWLVLEKFGMMRSSLFLCGANTNMLVAAMAMKDTISDAKQLGSVLIAESKSGISEILGL